MTPANCEKVAEAIRKIDWDKRMPQLAKFNKLLITLGKEQIRWR
jgi:hypothetical protein